MVGSNDGSVIVFQVFMNNGSSFPHTQPADSLSVGRHGGMFIGVDCLRRGNKVIIALITLIPTTD